MSKIMNRAAIAQLCSTADKPSNLAQIAHCAGQARDVGASMLFLPECFGFMSDLKHKTLDYAEQLELSDHNNANNEKSCRMIINGLRDIAQEYNLWISGGGIHEVIDDEPTKVYNTHIILDNHGSIVAKYRKIHLFDVCIPSENVNLKESTTTATGDCGVVVCDSPLGGKLGLATCYDVRFPEQFALLKEKGAQILLVPSAFTVPTGQAHWHILLRARAIENQCYVLAAAQCGRHNDKRLSYGHSLAVDPWGKVLADAGGIDIDNNTCTASSTFNDEHDIFKIKAPRIITCDIDIQKIESIRQRMPVDVHRVNAKDQIY